jgi:type I restriction enzyme, S subunit
MRKYDTYKDSGIEWIGEIPSHWTLNKVKHNFSFKTGFTPPSGKTEYYENGTHVWINISDLQEKEVHDSVNKLTDKAIEDYKPEIVPKGSLLYSFKLSVGRVGFNTIDCYTNEAIFSINPNGSANLNFFYYSLPEQIIKNANENIYGAKILNQELIKNAFLVAPPPEEQTAIADYLDRKTAEIDELIADKKRLLELYEEEKTAIINQAVTKGINPDVPMKDSGIEWLGEIPEHWEVKKIGHCGKIVRGGSPRPTGDPRYFFGDYIHWITVKEVTNAVGKYVVGTEEYLTEEGSKNSRIIEPETLLLSNSGATLGVPKISKIRGCINDGSVAFPELKPFLNRDYLYYFFVSHTGIYREQMAGNGQPNLNTEIIKSTFIPVPSTIGEQAAIIEFIEIETQKVASKRAKTEKLIELLTEYRTALINEVVTGKIKVIE